MVLLLELVNGMAQADLAVVHAFVHLLGKRVT